ncbi:MAG: tetratricopeptide repeat protein [Nitrospinae bacterium]|nr:tetratricopeptide repeat protein [Nitrospinota bacterium]
MNIHYKRLKSILLNFLPSFWAGIFIITSLIIIAYYNTIASPFNFDDEPAIIDNESIRSLSNIPDRITDIFSRPVLFISFTINYHIGGLDPTSYHVVNIGLHIAVSILIYLIVWHIVRGSGFGVRGSGFLNPQSAIRNPQFQMPFLSAALFAIHPINTESVTYIISRSSVLSTFFYLLSLLMFIKGNKKETEDRGQRTEDRLLFSGFWLLASCFFFILALGSKEDAVTLPAILLLYHFFFISEEKTLKDYLKRYRWVIISLALLAISYPLLRYIRLGIVGTSEAKYIYTPFTYLMTGIKVIVYYYMKLLLFPVNLNVDPHIISSQFSDFYFISAFIFIMALLVIILRKKNGLLSFSVLWYFIALSPTSSIFPLNDPATEHRVYLPAVGFCIFMAYCLITADRSRLQTLDISGKRSQGQTAMLLIIILLFSMLTIKRNFIWGDEAMVWKDSTKKSPNKPRPYYNMALYYEKMGLQDKAIWGYKKTLEHLRFKEQPYFWTESHLQLAAIYDAKGLYMSAIPLYERVLSIYPEKPEALNGLAVVYMKLNQFEKSKEMLEKVIRIKPDCAEAHNNLGTVYVRMDMIDEAFISFKKAIKIKPNYREAIMNLGILQKMSSMN